MNKPVLLVVDDDPQVLAAVRRDLRTQYSKSYAVVSAASGEEALATIRELKARGDSLAMMISDQRMPGLQGTEVLAQSRDIYPLARRVLLTAYSDIDAAIKAINLAHLDHYLSKPWTPPEECLFPVVDDLLDAWQAEYLPETKGLRLVGHQWSPRSHEIKSFLAGNLIPYRWLDVARDPEARSLLDAAGISISDLPALFFEDGTSLCNPAPRQVAERLGRSLSATLDLYDLVIVGAGPSGLAAAVYGASEGLRTLLLDRHAPGGQAGSSSRIENYLGFPRRRQRQRTDAARRQTGAAARGRAGRAARGHWRLHRRGIQAVDAQRRPPGRHADHAGRNRHGISRAPCGGRGDAHGGRSLLRRGDDGGAGIQWPTRARRRRWELRRTGGDASRAVRDGGADRRAPRVAVARRCRRT